MPDVFAATGSDEPGPGFPHESAVPAVDLRRPTTLGHATLLDLACELHRRMEGPLGRAEIRALQALAPVLRGRLADIENRFSLAHLQELLGTYFFWHLDVAETLEGQSVVELGAGSENPLAAVFALVLLGARRGVAIDVSQILCSAEQARALSAIAVWLARLPTEFVKLAGVDQFLPVIECNAARFDLLTLAAGELVLPDHLSFRCSRADATGLPAGWADRVLSSSFLEHVDSPGACIAEIARITSLGGISIHNVDTSDHGIYSGEANSPVEFLTCKQGEALVRTANRWRIHQLVRQFESVGFRVLKSVVYEWHDWTRAELAARVPPFTTMTADELRPLKAVLVLRYEAPGGVDVTASA